MADQRENTSKPVGQYEEKGIVQDVAVPIAASGVGGAAAGATSAWVNSKINQGKNPPSGSGKRE